MIKQNLVNTEIIQFHIIRPRINLHVFRTTTVQIAYYHVLETFYSIYASDIKAISHLNTRE